jgi:uncharacterized protein YjbI with pentapeptide repeats
LTAPQVLEAYRAGERDFRHVNISGVDLSGSDLRGASFLGGNLRGINLSHCKLTHVQLKIADVTHANLSQSRLNATDLISANFSYSNLSQADFTGAALYQATFVNADLSNAHFGSSQLGEANFASARLTGSRLYDTVLCDLDVSAFCDEPQLVHSGPSYIDYRTVVKSHHNPRFRQFMIDCGVPALFSEFMIDCAQASDEYLLRRLMQSTFISYGGPDEAFARRLYDALKARGVVTFFFPQTATVGARIGDEVFRGIQVHDRVLLICSRKSLDRSGVVNEIQETLDREARDGGATYLLPITLDDYVFNGWSTKQPVLAERVGRRVVGDFRGTLRSKVKFEAALDRVVDALKKKRP